MYELDDPDAPDVPTTLRRSKEDCPRVGGPRPLLVPGPAQRAQMLSVVLVAWLHGWPCLAPPRYPFRCQRGQLLTSWPLQPQETAMGVLDHGVLGRIAKIMSYMTLQGEVYRHGGKCAHVGSRATASCCRGAAPEARRRRQGLAGSAVARSRPLLSPCLPSLCLQAAARRS